MNATTYNTVNIINSNISKSVLQMLAETVARLAVEYAKAHGM
jgi:hypothetical protein